MNTHNTQRQTKALAIYSTAENGAYDDDDDDCSWRKARPSNCAMCLLVLLLLPAFRCFNERKYKNTYLPGVIGSNVQRRCALGLMALPTSPSADSAAHQQTAQLYREHTGISYTEP